jgi:hypothetical protein
MSIAYIFLHGSLAPRIFPKARRILQLSPDTKIGDLFLFENHTIIRISGIILRMEIYFKM